MSWNLTLDILLIVLILLFAPIGFMRGPVKELLVTLGVVFGALLVEFWARPWGRDLDSYFDVGEDPGAFVVAMAFLMLVTFIGGYGSGTVLASWEHSTAARALGAGIAALNGILLVSFSLQYVRLFLLSDANEESLEESFVVRLLLDQTGWILLAAALVVVPVVFYALTTGKRAYLLPGHLPLEDDEEWVYEYEDWDIEDEEFVPAPAPVRPESRPADVLREPRRDHEPSAETRVMPPRVPTSRPSSNEGLPYKADPAPQPSNPAEATRRLHADIERSHSKESGGTSASAVTGQTDPEMTLYAPIAEIPGPVPAEQEPAERLPAGYFRCENCHSVLPPETKICTVCGHIHE